MFSVVLCIPCMHDLNFFVHVFHVIGDQDVDGTTEGVQVPAADQDGDGQGAVADGQGAAADQDDAAVHAVQAEGVPAADGQRGKFRLSWRAARPRRATRRRGGVEQVGSTAAWSNVGGVVVWGNSEAQQHGARRRGGVWSLGSEGAVVSGGVMLTAGNGAAI